MSRQHNLKILPEYFNAVDEGKKNFEVRVNDRNFQEGDVVTLKEFNNVDSTYSGMELTFQIGYVFHLNRALDYENDYVVFSLIRRK